MRKIKFRAWDKDDNIMFYPDKLWHNINLGLKVDTGYNFKNGNIIKVDYEKVILMQYTGLHDKNGVDIYEGDIVRLTTKGTSVYDMSDELALQNIRIIAYDDNECRFNWARSKSGTCFCKNNAEKDCFEVIGNKWENPELLEDKS